MDQSSHTLALKDKKAQTSFDVQKVIERLRDK